VLRHRRKPSGRRRPTIRHKWNNGACGDKAEAATERAENTWFLVPESGE
jgi:tRNA nucleotidyltransferase/poly(A) polymerase